MSDRYAQLVNAPRRLDRSPRSSGCRSRSTLERRREGAPGRSPAAVLSGAAPGGRLERAAAGGPRPDRGRTAPAPRARPRRWSSTPPGSPTRPSWSSCSASSTPASAGSQRNGRVVVLGTPPAEAGSTRGRDRAARAGGLHPLARQGDRRPRRDRPARARRRGRRGPARLDPALPALAALGLRLRPGGAGRPGRRPAPRDRLGAAARRQDGAGHRRLARDRRRDRRDPGAATAPRVVGLDVPQAARGPRARSPPRSTATRSSSTSPRADAPERIAERLAPTASTSSSTTPASPATGRSRKMPEERWSAADGDQPLQRGADQRRPARRAACCAANGRIVCVSSMSRDRRQLRPDQLRRPRRPA